MQSLKQVFMRSHTVNRGVGCVVGLHRVVAGIESLLFEQLATCFSQHQCIMEPL